MLLLLLLPPPLPRWKEKPLPGRSKVVALGSTENRLRQKLSARLMSPSPGMKTSTLPSAELCSSSTACSSATWQSTLPTPAEPSWRDLSCNDASALPAAAPVIIEMSQRCTKTGYVLPVSSTTSGSGLSGPSRKKLRKTSFELPMVAEVMITRTSVAATSRLMRARLMSISAERSCASSRMTAA